MAVGFLPSDTCRTVCQGWDLTSARESACLHPHCHHHWAPECPVPPDKTQPCSCIRPVWKVGLFCQSSYWRSKPNTGIFKGVEHMAYSTIASAARPVQSCPSSAATKTMMLQRAQARGRVGCAFALCGFCFIASLKMQCLYLKTKLLKLASNSVLSA